MTHDASLAVSCWSLTAALAATLMSTGCADDTRESDEGEAGVADSASPGDVTGLPEVDTGDEGGGGGSSTGGERLDVADPGTAGEGGDGMGGCTKVDFLFFIDSSPSMQDEQRNLQASFPGFVSAIKDDLGIDDFQVMVVDAQVAEEGDACETTLGAGRIAARGGEACGLPEGRRYATGDADLAAQFQCLGSVGTEGPADEEIVGSVLAAVGPQSAPGGCNEGFLREDAVLVVTIIADEEDSPLDDPPMPILGFPLPPDGSCRGADEDRNSGGAPVEWKQAVLDAKGGREDHIVMLSVVGDCDVSGGSCAGIRLLNDGSATGAEPAPRLREFASSFSFNGIGSVCAPDYSPFFAEAAGLVSQACRQFNPG